MTIGDKIRLHRKALGLTQTELGEKLGVKTNAVSKWECGRVDDIPTSKIKAMAKLFDVQPSYLIDEKQPAPTNEDELNAEVKRIADQYKMEEDKVRELINVDEVKHDLAINKAIDFIKSHANVVEKAAEAEKTEDAQ